MMKNSLVWVTTLRVRYSIYYRIVEGVIRVYAVLDNRADPQSNDERLGAAIDLNP